MLPCVKFISQNGFLPEDLLSLKILQNKASKSISLISEFVKFAKIRHFANFFHFYQILDCCKIKTLTNFENSHSKNLDLLVKCIFVQRNCSTGRRDFAAANFKIPPKSQHFSAMLVITIFRCSDEDFMLKSYSSGFCCPRSCCGCEKSPQ